MEFGNDHDVWKAERGSCSLHENKHNGAICFHEHIVKKHYDNCLNVSATVPASLCASYIMTSQSEDAELLMRKTEEEEDQSPMMTQRRKPTICGFGDRDTSLC